MLLGPDVNPLYIGGVVACVKRKERPELVRAVEVESCCFHPRVVRIARVVYVTLVNDSPIREQLIAKLLEELEDMYPPLTVDPSMTHEVILYRAGQRSVVDYLKAKIST